jgi:hypothetical protein
VLEIKPKHELYDYECKYTHGMSEYIVPAEIPSGNRKSTQGSGPSLLTIRWDARIMAGLISSSDLMGVMSVLK